MKNDLPIKDGIIIPDHEIEVSTSKSGGAGGQHVNKTETKITVRWNVHHSQVLTQELKQRVLENLASQLTTEGDLIIHNSTSRSQQQNLKMALDVLADKITNALKVPKKRVPTRISKGTKASRRDTKAQRSNIKKMRSKINLDD
jgi:ribosome-associated protein